MWVGVAGTILPLKIQVQWEKEGEKRKSFVGLWRAKESERPSAKVEEDSFVFPPSNILILFRFLFSHAASLPLQWKERNPLFSSLWPRAFVTERASEQAHPRALSLSLSPSFRDSASSVYTCE